MAGLLAFGFFASAQETPTQMDDKNENAKDKMQQEPAMPAQKVTVNTRITTPAKVTHKVVVKKKRRAPRRRSVQTTTKVVAQKTISTQSSQ